LAHKTSISPRISTSSSALSSSSRLLTYDYKCVLLGASG